MFFVQIYDSSAALEHIKKKSQLCAAGWELVGLFAAASTNQTKKIPSFRCKTAEWSRPKAFLLRPQNLSPPALPRLTGSTLIPTRQLPLRLSFPFPPRSSGSSNCSSSQFIQRGFFFLLFLGACCSLFDLAALSTRQTVSTFNPPVCSLHLWFGRCACTWCSCVHTLTLGWWSRAHKGAQIAHNSAQ